MTHDDHQRERMHVWFAVYAQFRSVSFAAHSADEALAEFDKRFPAPSATALVEPAAMHAQPRVTCPAPVMPMAVDSFTGSLCAVQAVDVSELASLRQKARLWDAVASGKLGIYPRDGDFAAHWDIGHSIRPTAAEAVERAIAQGALK